MSNPYKNYHIGQRIKEVFDQKDLSLADFARKINCQRANVYNIFARRSINTDQLVIISKILEHNFLEEMGTILNKTLDDNKYWL